MKSSIEKGYDFSPLRTYQWVSPGDAGIDGLSAADRQLARGISRVVSEEFEKRGYVREEREPDFLVLVAATTQRGSRKGGRSTGGRARTGLSGGSFDYREGTILIRAWERERRILIWECWSREPIRESRPPTEEELDARVRRMMARFPAE